MHAAVGRRRGFEPCDEAIHVPMNEFALMNDHTVLLQGRGKSKISSAVFPPKSRLVQGGGIRNNIGYSENRSINESCGKRNVYPQAHKKDNTAPMSTETCILDVDGYAGISNVSEIPSIEGNIVRTQDEQKDKGKDLFFSDWPELGNLDDFEIDTRNFDSTFEIGSKYFEDPLWPSICSPESQLVPSSCLFDNTDLSTVSNESMSKPILPSVSVPDNTITEPLFLDQNNMADPINTQKPSRNEGSSKHLNCEELVSSSSEEIEQFAQHSDANVLCPSFDNVTSMECISSREGLEAIFCSNQEMQVPTSSSIMCNDEIASSSTCSGTDLAAAYAPNSLTKSHDPLRRTPDMILDRMSENTLEMYFPSLTAYEQPEQLMNYTSTQLHQFPEGFSSEDVQRSADLQFLSKGRTSAGSCEDPHSPLILQAVPVKDLGFQRLQRGMNQLDVASKTCIRDALYRLANCVEQRHCVASTRGVAESSGSNRFRSSGWSEIQANNPMDRSVAQLLLHKPLHRKTGLPPCQKNHVK